MIGRRALIALALVALLPAACGPGPAVVIRRPRSRLRTLEVGSGPLPFVLIHGYGASAEGWIPFTTTIRLPAERRFVLPEGPETTAPPDGPYGGRAWWRIGLDLHRRAADQLPDLSELAPPALPESTTRIRTLLDELAVSGGYTRDRQMLAGFSQGAIITADVAFTTDEPLEAVVLLSPTIVNERAWRAGMARRKGLRVFISHGRRDDILPFDIADRLRQAMQDAGMQVTWYPFDGGHDVPAEVVTALNRFLAAR